MVAHGRGSLRSDPVAPLIWVIMQDGIGDCPEADRPEGGHLAHLLRTEVHVLGDGS